MTSPILRPGDPGYEELMARNRERTRDFYTNVFIALTMAGLVVYFATEALITYLGLSVVYAFAISYFTPGIFAVGYLIYKLREDFSAMTAWQKLFWVFFGLPWTILLWPLVLVSKC